MELLPLHTLSESAGTSMLRFEAILPVAVQPVSSSHRHDYYEIFLFGKGGGHHMIDFGLYPVQDYSLHLVCPGQVHQLSREPATHGWVLMFSKDLLLSLLNFPGAQQQVPFLERAPADATVPLQEADFALLQTLFRQVELLQPVIEKAWQSPELVRTFLKAVILKCASLLEPAKPVYSSPADAAGSRLSGQFSQLVEEHFRQFHQVSDYANLLAVTSGHLNVISKTWLHKTAREVIQGRLLLEAKRLLLHTDQLSKEIAYSLCFDDPSHFAKFFKSHCQVSPVEFRQQMREMYR